MGLLNFKEGAKTIKPAHVFGDVRLYTSKQVMERLAQITGKIQYLNLDDIGKACGVDVIHNGASKIVTEEGLEIIADYIEKNGVNEFVKKWNTPKKTKYVEVMPSVLEINGVKYARMDQ